MKKDDFTTMVLDALLRFEPAPSRTGEALLPETVPTLRCGPKDVSPLR